MGLLAVGVVTAHPALVVVSVGTLAGRQARLSVQVDCFVTRLKIVGFMSPLDMFAPCGIPGGGYSPTRLPYTEGLCVSVL